MAEDFSQMVAQLADARNLVNSTKRELQEVQENLKVSRAEHANNLSESVRLRAEAEEQARIKDQLVKENDALRAEKDTISSKFTEETDRRYAELRKQENDIAAREGNVQLRLLECDKREMRLNDQMKSIEARAQGLVGREKDVEQREIDVEARRVSLESSVRANEASAQRVVEERQKVTAARDAAALAEAKAREAETSLRQETARNQAALVEMKNREDRAREVEARLPAVRALRAETEKILSDASGMTQEEIAKRIDAYFDSKTKSAEQATVVHTEDVPSEEENQTAAEPVEQAASIEPKTYAFSKKKTKK